MNPTPPTRPGTAPVDEAKLREYESLGEEPVPYEHLCFAVVPDLCRTVRALLAEREGLRKALELYREWCLLSGDEMKRELERQGIDPAALAPAPAHADGSEAGK